MRYKYQILNTISVDHSGVTLVELMVSVFLFSVTILMATGIFQTVVNSQRMAVINASLQDNIRYGFERMGREIKTAQRDAGHSCISSGVIYWNNGGVGDQLKFVNYRGQCVRYYLNNGQLYIAYPNSGDINLKNGLPLTPREVVISKLNFRVTDSATKVQGFVDVRMRLSVFVKGSPSQQIDMETSLSSRNYQKN